MDTVLTESHQPRWVTDLLADMKKMTDRLAEAERRTGTRRRDADLEDGEVNLSTNGTPGAASELASAMQRGDFDLTTSGQRRLDALTRQSAALFRRLSRQPTMAERNEIAAARQRADGLYARLGRATPDILPGELPSAYRKRLAAGLKDLSPQLRRANLDAVPDAALGAVEDKIYQDALEASRQPAANPTGALRPHTYQDTTGHTVTEYFGDPMAWMVPFMANGATVRLNRGLVK
jgi:hypothetical protein